MKKDDMKELGCERDVSCRGKVAPTEWIYACYKLGVGLSEFNPF